LFRQELADRLGDAGIAVFNFALNSWLFWPNCSCLQASIALHRGTGGDEYELSKRYLWGGGVLSVIAIGLMVGEIRS